MTLVMGISLQEHWPATSDTCTEVRETTIHL